MMKTWLMRRAVRRPVLDEVTARMSSSVCRLPFISSSPLRLVDQLDGFGRGGLAVGGIDDLEFADIELVLARDGGDLGGRPDEDRDDDPGLGGLDRAAKRRLVARMHDDRRCAAATFLALAIRRSYFDPPARSAAASGIGATLLSRWAGMTAPLQHENRDGFSIDFTVLRDAK